MSEINGDPFDLGSRPQAGQRRTIRGRIASWRQRRRPERWESDHEPYPAATVLGDLERAGSDLAAVKAVLARFAALQLVLQATAGVLSGEALAADREMATAYLADLAACAAAERDALHSVLRLAAAEPESALAAALTAAGAAAAARGHHAGARACYQAAFQLADAQRWAVERTAAARALAELTATDAA
jgi:hypothetical protein